jgi:hypothetical protein
VVVDVFNFGEKAKTKQITFFCNFKETLNIPLLPNDGNFSFHLKSLQKCKELLENKQQLSVEMKMVHFLGLFIT